MGIITPTPWARQPQFPVGINWGNPLTAGLLKAINGAHTPYSSSLGSIGQTGGILKFNETTSIYREYAGTWSQRNTNTTLMAVYTLPAAPTTAARLCGNFSSSSYGYGFAPTNSPTYRFIVARGGANTILVGSSVVAGRRKVDFGSFDSTNAYFHEYWLGGSQTTGPTAHGGITAPSGSQYFRIGVDNAGTSSSNSRVELVVVWGRLLSSGEQRALADNPWQIFSPLVSP